MKSVFAVDQRERPIRRDLTNHASSDDRVLQTVRTRAVHPGRVILLALSSTILISAALIVPGWIATLPRPQRRELTEALLTGVLAAYAVVVVSACFGIIVFGVWLLRARRSPGTRTVPARGFLSGVSCLFAITVVEFGADSWHRWQHRWPALPTSFTRESTRSLRILVLGGSSAAGEPYWPWLSVGQIVAWQLSTGLSGCSVECEILAYPGDSLEMQHQKLAAIERRPDVVIIYSGHNEFAARFEEEREGWQDGSPSQTGFSTLTRRIGLTSAFCGLAREVISKNRLDRPPSMALRHQLIDPPVCSDVEKRHVEDDFRRRLEAIVSFCDQLGAQPILIIPPANEAGYEPSRSTLSPMVSEAIRQELASEFAAAQALEERGPARSAEIYRSILDRFPELAEAHFRLARLLERAGRLTEARTHYLTALDDDGLPLRCQAACRAAYGEVARRHPRSILIDGRRELMAISRYGLLGDQIIHDTHHPTLEGYTALATAVLRELSRSGVIGDIRTITLPIDANACARHFGMNALKWSDVCNRISAHYGRVAGYRFDQAERLRKSRRYAEASRRILDGASTRDLGLPIPDLAGQAKADP